MALSSGIDLVLELPVVYALSSAEYFAYAAVKVLDSTGSVNFLSFGSECGKMDDLKQIAELLTEEPEVFKTLLKDYLNTGLSFPAARQEALSRIFPEVGHILDSPNNILGIEYLKAIYKLNSKINPFTIVRKGGSYRDTDTSSSVPGATAIRNRIKDLYDNKVFNKDILASMMPASSANILMEEFAKGRGPIFTEHFESMMLSCLRNLNASDILKAPDVSEGLENRIKEASSSSGNMEELLSAIYTKRYPATRVKRALFHLLTGISKQAFEEFNVNGGPQYIRVLGFNNTGRELLSIIKQKASLPVITKFADRNKQNSPLAGKMAEIESNTTNIYVIAFPDASQRKAGQEFTTNLIRV